MQDSVIQQSVQTELVSGEQVLWLGQPVRALFNKRDIVELPFGVFWLAFSIFWMYGASGHFDRTQNKGSGWFALFGIPFVLTGLYLVLGKFIYRYWRRTRTCFAVTNKRVLSVSDAPSRTTISAYLESLPAITKSVRRNGVGTLRFGNPLPSSAYWRGFPWGSESADDVPTFYDIPDAEMVFKMVSELREKTIRGDRRFGV